MNADIVEMKEAESAGNVIALYLPVSLLHISISICRFVRQEYALNKRLTIKNGNTRVNDERAMRVPCRVGDTNTSPSLARSFAWPFAPSRLRAFVYMYIIERTDFQGLPRASVIPSRAKRPRSRGDSETPRAYKAAVARARSTMSARTAGA